MIPENDNQVGGNLSAFGKTFVVTLIAAWIGHKLDQTAFGRWFNTNPVLNRIFHLLKVGLILMAVAAVCLYLWLLINQPGW